LEKRDGDILVVNFSGLGAETPLYWRTISTDAVPEVFAELNYIYFDTYQRCGMINEELFDKALSELETALKLDDILWIREHTKWVARAADWDRAAPPRPEGKLLPSGDIASAEAWARLKSPSAPEIPSVLADYLRESIAKWERDTMQLRRTVGRAFVKPAVEAMEDGLFDHALRLAAAGALLANDLELKLIPELWKPIVQSTFNSRLLSVLRGHDGEVIALEISPDGRYVLTASNDKTARLWDLRTGAEIAIFQGHTDTVWSASFSRDGTRIVTASKDGTARIWEVGTGGHEKKEMKAAKSKQAGKKVAAKKSAKRPAGKTVMRHKHSVETAMFSPDGKRVVTTSRDGTVRVWNADDGTEIALLKAGFVHYAAFSPDGKRIAVVASGRTALWDGKPGGEIALLVCDPLVLKHAQFSPDSKRVLTAGGLGKVELWDTESATQIAVLDGHEERVEDAVFSPDGKRVVTCSSDRTARVCDSETGSKLAVLNGHEKVVTSARFSPTGDSIVTTSGDGTARLWDSENGAEIFALKGHEGWLRKAAFSPDGKVVVTASHDNTARVWDARAGLEMAVLPHTTDVWTAEFSADGKRLLTVSDELTRKIHQGDNFAATVA
jgi:WD40 repeat protein